MQKIFLQLFFFSTMSFGFTLEENHDDDGNSVAEILRELNAERAKYQDLNQTISDILVRIEAMENNIAEVQDEVVTVAEDVESNSVYITNLAEDVVSFSTKGSWCASRDHWNTRGSVITFDRLTFSESNMNITGPPLDIDTGNKLLN